jgi:hypothetical protein
MSAADSVRLTTSGRFSSIWSNGTLDTAAIFAILR